MALFSIKENNALKLSITKINREKYIQDLFEKNLQVILNITFLKSEYSTSFGGRIDTLGIDKNGAPVIIEYKKNQNDNVINQGLSYLRWLLDHKADFEILCMGSKIDTGIDWTSPRVICIAESYNKFDLDTVEILPIKIELYKYKLYENNLLELNMENQRKIKISTSKIYDKAKQDKKEDFLQKNYSVEDHLKNASNDIKELFLKLKEKIMELDDSIVEEAKAKYMAYKLTTNFVDIVIQKDAIKSFLNVPSGKLNDPKHKVRDLTKPKPIGHWGNGDYEIKVSNLEDLDYLFDLIKQSYEYNK